MPHDAARRAPLILILASVALLAAALAFQYLGGLQPCVLCIYQRWPHVAVIVLAGLALLPLGARWRSLFLLLAAAALLVGAGIGVFHVGVEQHWWEGTASCGGTVSSEGLTAEELRDRLLAAPPVRCDQVAWSLFGISMAGYNVLISLVLAAGAALAARALGRRPAA
jgi:disulfide bond formation protein DsbB